MFFLQGCSQGFCYTAVMPSFSSSDSTDATSRASQPQDNEQLFYIYHDQHGHTHVVDSMQRVPKNAMSLKIWAMRKDRPNKPSADSLSSQVSLVGNDSQTDTESSEQDALKPWVRQISLKQESPSYFSALPSTAIFQKAVEVTKEAARQGTQHWHSSWNWLHFLWVFAALWFFRRFLLGLLRRIFWSLLMFAAVALAVLWFEGNLIKKIFPHAGFSKQSIVQAVDSLKKHNDDLHHAEEEVK